MEKGRKEWSKILGRGAGKRGRDGGIQGPGPGQLGSDVSVLHPCLGRKGVDFQEEGSSHTSLSIQVCLLRSNQVMIHLVIAQRIS